MKIEIKSWVTGKVLFEAEAGSLKLAVEAAVEKGVSLNYARLDGASLDGARLDGARLDRASLDRARLDGASLVGARLVGARLDRASLDRARLDGASLDRARLDGASLVGARLDRASLDRARLDGARLVGARLDGASLEHIKHDMWAVLCMQPREVAGLREAIVGGRINGSTYSDGDCHCLVGTLADVAGRDYQELDQLKPDAHRPIERWFLGIKEGDTPETNQLSKLALDWLDEWFATPAGQPFAAVEAASK